MTSREGSADGQSTPGRKSRRSWFDAPPLTTLESHPEQRLEPKRATKRRSVDSVGTLTLTHFTTAPKISFGKVIVGKTKFRTLLIRNPNDYEQEVIIERFPYKKKFMIDHTRFTVGPEDVFNLEITWTPEESEGCREMILLHVNGIYRLQAFVLGTAEKPKPPRKVRKFAIGPKVKQPSTVMQTAALSSIRCSYSPRRSEEARDLLENLAFQPAVAGKENQRDLQSQEMKICTVKEQALALKHRDGLDICRKDSSPVPVSFSHRHEGKEYTTCISPDKEVSKTPNPLESTAIFPKSERVPSQWQKLSDITSPTLNTMSPIPLSEENSNGITVDSYFQINDTKCGMTVEQGVRKRVVGHTKTEEDECYQGCGKNYVMKETFVMPYLPSKQKQDLNKLEKRSSVAENKMLAAENCTFISVPKESTCKMLALEDIDGLCATNEESKMVKLDGSDQTKHGLQRSPISSADVQALMFSGSQDSEMRKRMEWSSQLDGENCKGTCGYSPVSPNTVLNESLKLISQTMTPREANTAMSPPSDGHDSMNVSVISQGKGMVSPNSFVEDMKAMGHKKDRSTEYINGSPSPSSVLNSSIIPHRVMVDHLQNIRSSLSNSPSLACTKSGRNMTPRKPSGVKAKPKRRSLTSVFRHQEGLKAAAVLSSNKGTREQKATEVKDHRNMSSSKGGPEKKRGKFVSCKIGQQEAKVSVAGMKRGANLARKEDPNSKKRVLKRRSPYKLNQTQEHVMKRVKVPGSIVQRSAYKAMEGTSPANILIKADDAEKISNNDQSLILANFYDTTLSDTPNKEPNIVDSGTVVKSRSFECPNNNKSCLETALPCEEICTNEKNSSLTRRGKLFPDATDGKEIDDSDMKKVNRSAFEQEQGRGDSIHINLEQNVEFEAKERYEHQNENTSTRDINSAEGFMQQSTHKDTIQSFRSPSTFPTSPCTALDNSRRGTLTVTKSRPSSALRAAINKNIYLDASQPSSPCCLHEDDTESTENIQIRIEEHYESKDGQMYKVVKETTDVVKTTTETYTECLDTSPQSFHTPTRLPVSPRPELSRRSTHVVRSPKVIDLTSMKRRHLDYAEFDLELRVDQNVNQNDEKEMGVELFESCNNHQSTKQKETGIIENLLFESEKPMGDSYDCKETEVENVSQVCSKECVPIVSVCLKSTKIVDYDTVSEDDSGKDISNDSLDTNQSVDSIERSFSNMLPSSSKSMEQDEQPAFKCAPLDKVSSFHNTKEADKVTEDLRLSPRSEELSCDIDCLREVLVRNEAFERVYLENPVETKQAADCLDFAEQCIDRREMFEPLTRAQIYITPRVEEIPYKPVVSKGNRNLRRSFSAGAMFPENFIVDASDFQEVESYDGIQSKKDLKSQVTNDGKESSAKPKQHNFIKPVVHIRKNLAPTLSHGQVLSGTCYQIQATGLKQKSRSLSNLVSQPEKKKKLVGASEGRQTRPVIRGTPKMKGPIKGVAQSRLILVKKSNTGTPRHPMPFAARNMYYDERWMEKQERGFVQWLNFVLTPPDEYVAVTNKPRVDAGALSLDVHQVAPRLAPTNEILSFRAYAARRRLNRLRRAACELYQSKQVVNIIQKIEVEVEKRRLAVRKDKMVHADLGIKQKLLDLLLQYNSLWLRIGLETVFGEILMIQSNKDVLGLSRFIMTRLLSCPDLEAEYAHPTVPHLFKDGYSAAVCRHTVKKFVLLVYFLDQAKSSRLLEHNPCLFCKDAEIKTSKEILVQFSREILSGEGDVTRHLAYLGYTVSQSQRPIDEFDYAVKNLSNDLRNGVRLSRILELLAGDAVVMKQLRLPAISRLQKIHNMEVFFKAISRHGLDLSKIKGAVVTARDVVDGHREKTLFLLWHLFIHCQGSIQVNEDHLREEISLLTKSLKLKLALQKIGALAVTDFQVRRDSGQTVLSLDNERMRLVFQWCHLVCLHYGVKVENFTVSFSDGRALCCLLHHYHPALLPLSEVRFQTTVSFQEKAELICDENMDADLSQDWASGGGLLPKEDDPQLFMELLANEKHNFKVLYEKVSALGGVPLMLKAADMSNTIPDEKVVSMYISYLCARLLDIREEVRAAKVIQLAWRRMQLQKAIQERRRKTEAVITIQKWIRPILLRLQQAKERWAAVKLQSLWRRYLAKRFLDRIKQQELQEAKCERADLAALVIQRLWRRHVAYVKLRNLKTEKIKQDHDRKREMAAIIFQSMIRGKKLRQEFLEVKRSVVTIQTVWRGYLGRKELSRRREEAKMMQAVCIIQKWIRGRLCLRHFRRVKTAVVVLQKNWRMLHCKRTFQGLMEQRIQAAITIQKWVRGFLCLRKFEKLKRSAMVLQSQWRIRNAKVVLKEAREYRAATVIQSWVRSQLLRNKFLSMKKAAATLQKHWRGWSARNRLTILKEKKIAAVVLIQKFVRAYKARQTYHSLSRAILIMQKTWRMQKAKREFKRLQEVKRNHAAVTIQKYFRAFLCRRQLKTGKLAARRIQSFWRVYLAKKELSQLRRARWENEAATVIQKMVRGFKCRQNFILQKYSVCILQNMWRVVRAKRILQILRTQKQERAALVIQKNWRGFTFRQSYLCKRTAIITVQSYWRMFLATQNYERAREAILIIQHWQRANVLARQVRETYLKKRKSAVLIQSVWRCRREQRKFLAKKQAAITIQANFRCFRRRLKFMALRLASIIVQRGYRNYLLRKQLRVDYLAMEHAAVVIQKRFRKHLRKKAEKMQTSATKIQAMFKAWKIRKHFVAQKAAALVIQRKFREFKHMKQDREIYLKQKNAATVIQSAFRSKKDYVSYQNLRDSIVKIQAAIRCRQARLKYLKLRKATLVIQERFRAIKLGGIFRNNFLLMQQSAITIQRFYRAVKVGQQILEMLASQNAAATKIQSMYRCWRQRRDFLVLRAVSISCQRRFVAWRTGRDVRQKLESMRVAAKVVQRGWRRYRNIQVAKLVLEQRRKWRQRELKIKEEEERLERMNRLEEERQEGERKVVEMQRIRATLVLQKYARSYLKRREDEKKEANVIILQKNWRRYLAKSRYQATICSICLLQRIIKGFSDRMKFQRLRQAAVVIQRRWRDTRLCRQYQKSFDDKRHAAIKIQSTYRMMRQKTIYIHTCQSIIRLQASVKCFLWRKRYVEIKQRLICLQRRIRGHQAMKRDRELFLIMRHSAIKIQGAVRLWLACVKIQKEKSAVQLQTFLRMYQQRKAFKEAYEAVLVLQSFLEAKQHQQELQEQEEAARTIQLLFTKYLMRKRELENNAACIIQRNARKYLHRRAGVKFAAACVIQRASKRFLLQRTQIKHKAVIKIQTSFRFLRERRRFLSTQRSVVLVQSVARGWFARRLAEKLRTRRSALIALQACVRGYLTRKSVMPVLENRRQELREKEKCHSASTKIQALWRGYVTRKKMRSKKLTQTRKRLQEANRSASEEKTLGSRSSSALEYLLWNNDLAHILEALMHLEVSTRLSPVCCEQMVQVGAVTVLYRLINGCNRSLPHMELIKYAVDILLNLAKYEKTVQAVIDNDDSISTILELMQIYREKGAIFFKTCMLLGILGSNTERSQTILKHPEITARLQSIHSVILRKQRANRSRQVTQARMTAMKSFNCTLPVSLPGPKRHRICPDWALVRDSLQGFGDSLAAITFVMDVLHIGPKM